MKELIKYSAFLMVSFFVLGCNDDDADFMVQLNEPFLAVIDEEYTCITNDGDEIIIKVDGIDDNRVGGVECDRVIGSATGEAEVGIKIILNEKKYSETFLWPGCDGVQEYNPSNPNLPSFELENGCVLKMMKLYPNSENITAEFPSSKDYQIKLIILK